MKKTLLFVVISVIVFICVLASCGKNNKEQRPFAELNVADISSVSVRIFPPDKTFEIVDLDELADALNDVVIYEEDSSYREYYGQSATYTIKMNDGTVTEVIAFNPVIVIDGVGYKTEYKPCEKLSQIANELLE